MALEHALLAKNDRIAEHNRGWLAGRGVVCFDVLGGPGSGKTTLLVRTLEELGAELGAHVVEGDQETARDAERIRATGRPALQINTGTGCHLDAAMIRRALPELDPPSGSTLFVENVGNLVCPALFDLGEHAKIVLLSVTEGDDKPLKYPHVFRASELLVVSKIDLAPHVSFDVERCVENARRVNPRIEVVRLSATSGEGLDEWYAWLRRAREARAPRPA